MGIRLFCKHLLNSSGLETLTKLDCVFRCGDCQSRFQSCFQRSRVPSPLGRCQSSPGVWDQSWALDIWAEGTPGLGPVFCAWVCVFGHLLVNGEGMAAVRLTGALGISSPDALGLLMGGSSRTVRRPRACIVAPSGLGRRQLLRRVQFTGWCATAHSSPRSCSLPAPSCSEPAAPWG